MTVCNHLRGQRGERILCYSIKAALLVQHFVHVVVQCQVRFPKYCQKYLLRCYSGTTRSVEGWCWTKSVAEIKLLIFLRLCSIRLFPEYPARTKTLHCYLRRTKRSLVLEMRCILHLENSLQRERVFETVLRLGIKSFSMLRTGGSLGHLRTSGGAKHTGPWHWVALPFKPGWKVGRPPLAWLWRRRWW